MKNSITRLDSKSPWILGPLLKKTEESGFIKLWNYRVFTVRRCFMICKIVNRVTFSPSQKSVSIANKFSQESTVLLLILRPLLSWRTTVVSSAEHEKRTSVRTNYHQLWNKNSNKFDYEVSLDFGIWTVLTMIVLFINPISFFVMRYTITDPTHVT